jgi:hypothetical protein
MSQAVHPPRGVCGNKSAPVRAANRPPDLDPGNLVFMSGRVNEHAIDQLARRRAFLDGIDVASPRQDDFAKWPILDQMAQGFARFGEGIDPLDNWLD